MRPPPKIQLGADHVTIVRATPDDLERVLGVVHDSTRRVQELGFAVWRLYLTEEGTDQVRARVNGDGGAEVYLAVRASDGRAVGTFALVWGDPEMWGEARGNDGRAGYVHTLAVHREAKHQRLGEHLLGTAEGLVAEHGMKVLRLDCWRRSEFLRAYYARLGFRAVEEDEKQGILLWEKRVRR